MDCPKCEVGEIRNRDDVIRESRKFITCVLSGLNLKFITIDNGIKYQVMYYIETGTEDLKNMLDQIINCLNEELGSAPKEIREYLSPRVKLFEDTYVIMFNNEFIAIKAAW
ncbi:MAG: hypothetical protein TU36_004850 [Vulcanisaeta sp. AZ3]